ncbi:Succinate--hydroxymethylglutarate CoA-transferase [Aphelenchoides bicaudatus]|nr:Succinate--hydroxymethylglutarate CoA-transferase [Aphelenchoides bicaudatus]
MSVSLLNGVKVLDFSRILAAPYATQLLGDLGATIWKIERTKTGDEVRRWTPPEVNGQSCYYLAVNRSKKSISLNLATNKGQQIARNLALKADVLIENFKTGQMKKFGLDYESLSTKKPDLIYCSVTGYGSTGPYANEAGYDVIAEAIGGFMSITGSVDGEPCKAGVAIIDLLTGTHLFASVLGALLHKERTGAGQKIGCNLLATQISALANIGSNYLNAGIVGDRNTSLLFRIKHSKQKISRYYVIGAGDDSAFKKLCLIMQLDELAQNSNYETNAKRVENRVPLLKTLSDKFLEHDLAYWIETFKSSKLPSGPVNSVAEAFEHEQVKHLKLVQELFHPNYGKVKTVGNTVTYSTLKNEAQNAPPLLGEHTEEVLKEELGISSEQLSNLIDEGVIGCC